MHQADVNGFPFLISIIRQSNFPSVGIIPHGEMKTQRSPGHVLSTLLGYNKEQP